MTMLQQTQVINTGLLFQLINIGWVIQSFAVGTVCWLYIAHEWLARPHRRWRWCHWTLGMRLAFAISLISAGTWLNRSVIYAWRHWELGDDFIAMRCISMILVASGIIGTIGFIAALYEIGKPLFGSAPWVIAMGLSILGLIYTIGTTPGVLAF
jgi:hypothetical protein